MEPAMQRNFKQKQAQTFVSVFRSGRFNLKASLNWEEISCKLCSGATRLHRIHSFLWHQLAQTEAVVRYADELSPSLQTDISDHEGGKKQSIQNV
ncbi:hypothetical protein NC652_028896 [Populus alba x Populus x berolinensis]|nr:hypothetical protein NC652_028896 [Populus alba x Populus x berolinensis]